jgi:hypothetical protein
MTIQPTDQELEQAALAFIAANQDKGQVFYFSSELPYFLGEGTEYEPLIALLRNAWNQGAAAALRAAADQVVPDDYDPPRGVSYPEKDAFIDGKCVRNEDIRFHLLAIAAELDPQ